MLSDVVRIINFDDSTIRQKKLLQQFQPTIIDLIKIGRSCRLWLDNELSGEVRCALQPELKNSITLLGSGDYHHISRLLIEQFLDEPLTIIIFDFHPDWDVLPPRLGCGSWVSHILKNKNVKKIILLGVSSHDISSRWIQTGNLKALENNRVEIYPYIHGPTKVLCKDIPTNISMRVHQGMFFKTIYWHELHATNIKEFLQQILGRIETKKVYVSIDKDCLKSSYALTNWEEGCFSLSELLALLLIIKERTDIAGLDIVGEYSVPRISGIIKSVCSWFDHPEHFTARGKEWVQINATNEETNIKLLEQLCH